MRLDSTGNRVGFRLGHPLDLDLLDVLMAAEQPIGAGTIYGILSSQLATSEASVGRRLRELDRGGCTKRLGRQGRVITEKGRAQLQTLRQFHQRSAKASALIAAMEADTLDRLIEVLEARMLLETEIARWAARRATPEDVQRAREILRRQQAALAGGDAGAAEDFAFHRLLAEMSGRVVLGHAVDLIREQSQLSPQVALIRQRISTGIAREHMKIIEAIEAGDPGQAARAMTAHIRSIIRDVRRYWKQVWAGRP